MTKQSSGLDSAIKLIIVCDDRRSYDEIKTLMDAPVATMATATRTPGSDTHAFEIANTIRDQLMCAPAVVWSWGAHKYLALCADETSLGGLNFKVSGAKFQGLVSIRLTLVDTYTISFIDEYMGILEVHENVYCGMMHEVIDQFVET